MKPHLLPRPLPYSSDPVTDLQIGYAWRAAVVLTALFLGLRLAGVTSWAWWAVFMPAESVGGTLFLGVMAMAAWALADPRALDGWRN